MLEEKRAFCPNRPKKLYYYLCQNDPTAFNQSVYVC